MLLKALCYFELKITFCFYLKMHFILLFLFRTQNRINFVRLTDFIYICQEIFNKDREKDKHRHKHRHKMGQRKRKEMTRASDRKKYFLNKRFVKLLRYQKAREFPPLDHPTPPAVTSVYLFLSSLPCRLVSVLLNQVLRGMEKEGEGEKAVKTFWRGLPY